MRYGNASRKASAFGPPTWTPLKTTSTSVSAREPK